MLEAVNRQRRLSPEELEQKLRDAHQTYLDASLDRVTGNQQNGAAIGITPELAWEVVRSYQTILGKETYDRILSEPSSRPSHWD